MLSWSDSTTRDPSADEAGSKRRQRTSEVHVRGLGRQVRSDALRREGREAYERLRTYLILAVQAGTAAGLSWFIASDLLNNPQPLFAPAASIGTIAAALGNRIRRAAELIAGVIVGVAVGQVIVDLVGTGPIQTGVIVAFAISSTAVIRGSGAVMVHAGSTAVLLGSLTADQSNLAIARTVNGLIGAVTAIAVALLILPANPVRIVHRSAGPTLDIFARNLTDVSTALRHRNMQQARDALHRLIATEEDRDKTMEMVAAASEIAVLSPWRWRRMTVLRRYRHAAEHLQLAYSNSREAAHWAIPIIRRHEPVPSSLPEAIEHLGQAIRLLHRDFLAQREPDIARARASRVIRDIDRACSENTEFCCNVLLTRLRLAVSEVLQASGSTLAEANREAGLAADAG
ncbi:FUSC family protein [Micromonospora sp. WMMD1076]|uniref:FUSC family protein n=1 Tax=Micromonospora TaxID=1873 RepID=UPI00249B5599|nr:FUSC family protein [Micromonospora sp. WMMD1076]WFF04717.1 FUSC family protein [Micromonospora sp. WMMD1076]